MRKVRVLVACEESQAVTKAFRKLGAYAFSCDLQECSGGHPEWHLQADALTALEGEWDLVVAHPPCTYLTAAGNRWMRPEYRGRYPDRVRQRDDAAVFFMRFWNCRCPRVAIENPVGVMSSYFRKPDQYVQPYWFGHPWAKKTGLWLRGLPKLEPTKMVEPTWLTYAGKRYSPQLHYLGGLRKDRQKIRSKTPEGMAEAMAAQWMAHLEKEINGRS